MPKKPPREIHSPNEDTAKEGVLQVTDVQLRIKGIIANHVLNDISRLETQRAINQLIVDATKSLPLELQNRVRKSLVQFAQSLYLEHAMNILAFNTDVVNLMRSKFGPDVSFVIDENKKSYRISIKHEVDAQGNVTVTPVEMITDKRFRDYVTDIKVTMPQIKEYETLVKEQYREFAAKPPMVTYEGKSGNPVRVSLRNYAEMQIRREANEQDVKRLANEGVDLVWASSHANSSKRCSHYQGQLYSLNNNKGRTASGIPYTPINMAYLGPEGDGNGIISGYNCRHYLIEFQEGSQAPYSFSEDEIKREQELDRKQRYYENQIRQKKMEEHVMRAIGDKEGAKRLNASWNATYEKYVRYSMNNKRPVYDWRTQVARGEVPVYVEKNPTPYENPNVRS